MWKRQAYEKLVGEMDVPGGRSTKYRACSGKEIFLGLLKEGPQGEGTVRGPPKEFGIILSAMRASAEF